MAQIQTILWKQLVQQTWVLEDVFAVVHTRVSMHPGQEGELKSKIDTDEKYFNRVIFSLVWEIWFT